MIAGLLAGLATGSLWGLTFVAPQAVEPYAVFDLAFARYMIFGLASAVLMSRPAFRPVGLRLADVGTGLALGVVGYVAYYLAVAYAVRLAGPAIPPLIVGALPIVLGLVGNWREGGVPWSRLAVPLGLVGAGLVIVNGEALLQPGSGGAVRLDTALGIASAILALLIWAAYAIVNAEVMRSAGAPNALVWTGLQGVGSAIGCLPLIPFLDMAPLAGPDPLADPATLRFVGWSLVLGLAGSWLATWLWVVASQRLPLALSAQLIVTETLFGLAYGFAYRGRWPSAAEAVGAAVLIVGVVLAIETFRRAGRTS